MAEFLVEMYAPALASGAPTELTARARAAADALARDGVAIQHVRTIFLPEEETCFHLFEAPSIDVVQRVVERADLSYTRITEAVG